MFKKHDRQAREFSPARTPATPGCCGSQQDLGLPSLRLVHPKRDTDLSSYVRVTGVLIFVNGRTCVAFVLLAEGRSAIRERSMVITAAFSSTTANQPAVARPPASERRSDRQVHRLASRPGAAVLFSTSPCHAPTARIYPRRALRG